jgi:hypothetical protein
MPCMTRDTRCVYLHIGLYKTGTTYLQNLWRANRKQLAEQGVHYPGGQDGPIQVFAVSDLFGRRPKGGEERIEGQWNELTAAVQASPDPITLISDESLSLATARDARKAVEGFPDHEVHVVATVRDLGRVLLSSWHQAIKSDETWTWRQFVDGVRDPARRGQNPGRSFWIRQDLMTILDVWQSVVPRDRIHVVTVPPAGASKDVLLERVGKVVGYDNTPLTEATVWDNRAFATADAEVLRRLNEGLGHRLNERQHHRVVRRLLTRELTRNSVAETVGLDPDDQAWVSAEGQRIVDDLVANGYEVVGDLADLVPAEAETPRRPDETSSDEMLDSALRALTAMTEEYARLWWEGTGARPTSPESAPRRGGRWRSRIRAQRFRVKRALLSLADRNRLAAMPVNGYLRLRDVRRRRSRPKS